MTIDQIVGADVFRFTKILSEELGGEIPLSYALAFLYVAQSDQPVLVGEIERACSMSKAAVSRAVGELSQYGKTQRGGLDLIRVQPDYHDRRRRPYVLTSRGKAVLARLAERRAAA